MFGISFAPILLAVVIIASMFVTLKIINKKQ